MAGGWRGKQAEGVHLLVFFFFGGFHWFHWFLGDQFVKQLLISNHFRGFMRPVACLEFWKGRPSPSL